MIIDDLLMQNSMTKYRLAKQAGIPHATLHDICNGKTRMGRCSAETIYRLAKALGVSVETLLEGASTDKIPEERERSYEYGLPTYLQHDLDAYKQARQHGSNLLDCLWGELCGSINAAEITDGAISPDHADYLRQKFLWR